MTDEEIRERREQAAEFSDNCQETDAAWSYARMSMYLADEALQRGAEIERCRAAHTSLANQFNLSQTTGGKALDDLAALWNAELQKSQN